MPDLSGADDPKPPEARLAALAGRQHGVVSREQLLGLGFTESFVKRALKAGRWIRLHRGVFAIGHANVGLKGRAMAAQLACGSGAVVSHGSAAALYGIRKEEPGPIHVTLPQSRANRPGLHTHESRSLRPDDVRIWWDVRVTTVERTLVDLADTLSTDELEQALSEAHRLGFIDRATTSFPHHPGRTGLAAVLRRGVRMTRSQIERRYLKDLRAAGDLPMPLANHWMHGYEADLHWPDHGLVIEIDDYLTHGDRRAFERDRRKQTAYALEGIMMIRLTEETLPEAVVTTRRLLASAGGGRS